MRDRPHLPRPSRLAAALCLVGLLVACGGQDEKQGGGSASGDVGETHGTTGPGIPPPRSAAQRHLEAPPTRIRLEDASATAGIDGVNHSGRAGVKEYLLEAVGPGPAWLDYDGDGWLDLYEPDGDVFSNYVLVRESDPDTGRPRPRLEPKSPRPETFRDRLWRNNGDGTFTDVAAEAGVDDARWSFGATSFDYDGDGDADIFVANYGQDRLWRNNGDGTFTDVAAEVGVAGPAGRWSTCAGVGDVDGDGRVDIYVAAYSDPAAEVERMRVTHGLPVDEPVEAITGRDCRWRGIRAYCGPRGLEGQDDALYLQRADGTFEDVTERAGLLPRTARYGFTTILVDFNEDGLLDIFIANDSVENFLWQQDTGQGPARFRDTSDTLGVKFGQNLLEQASMGAACADFNLDGLLDLFVTNFSHDYNNIYLGQRAGDGGAFYFRDRGLQVMGQEVYYDLSWGCGWYDLENDGDLDLYVANGHVYKEIDLFEKTGSRYEQLNALFEAIDAPAMAFREIGTKAQRALEADDADPEVIASIDAGPGMAVAGCSRAAAFADYDNDGRMDIVVMNMNERPTVLRNVSALDDAHRWIKLVLHQPGRNRDALGAIVEVTAGERTWKVPVHRVTSFLGCNDPRLHVGLGAAATCRVTVHWPGQTETTTYEGLEAGGLWRLDRATGEAERLPLPTTD